jgi:hypothetical protein
VSGIQHEFYTNKPANQGQYYAENLVKAAVISIVAKHTLRVMDGEPEIHGEEVGFCRPTRNIRFILEARSFSNEISPKSTVTKPVAKPVADSSATASVTKDTKKASAPVLSGQERRQRFQQKKGGLLTQSMIIKQIASQQNLKTDYGTTMLVLYGSQSGKSKELAERFAKLAELTEMFVNCRCIADYRFERLPMMKLVVVITSTYGHGEPPENAVPLYNWLNQSHPSDLLKNLQYAVLRLGSSGTGT